MSEALKTRIRRVPKNARYDRDSVYRVLDRGRVAHVSFSTAFEHSANYDSLVLFGRFREISPPEEKLAALEAFMQALLPGRWSEVRPPSRNELKGTAILGLDIAEADATVKTRNAPPDDDDSPDAERDTWAGVIPITCAHGAPEPSPGLRPGVTVDASVESLLDRAAC